MTRTHDYSRHCGDINLVAACMSLGIPLDASQPVTLVENVKRGNYASFFIAEFSDDGSEITDDLMAYWSGAKPIPPGHGFAAICDFIRARPRGIQKSADLLGFAVDYLRERGHALPGLRKIDDIPDFVKALPENDASHVLAYVWNRDLCWQLFRQASRQVYYQQGEGNETRRALIDARLPRWQAKELLSRLQG